LPKNLKDIPYVGYSDHLVGLENLLLVIARGAKVIEKCFTLGKSDTKIRDHALSASPRDFGPLLETGTCIEKNSCLGV